MCQDLSSYASRTPLGQGWAQLDGEIVDILGRLHLQDRQVGYKSNFEAESASVLTSPFSRVARKVVQDRLRAWGWQFSTLNGSYYVGASTLLVDS